MSHQKPLLEWSKAQMSHVVGCLICLQNVCPLGLPKGKETERSSKVLDKVSTVDVHWGKNLLTRIAVWGEGGIDSTHQSCKL
ncbi:hypothetical protein TNCT_655381 [Trichonephila clavata]|uniref:Uncharacterized protein n=1 Tax=Trichonephila clavata TaxID=2740835 RepID=A0A8X6KUM2_TRICU|nr:hypothetical protein TNCT_655381 [Trichonephila clavata]